jgi:hypothetical protein
VRLTFALAVGTVLGVFVLVGVATYTALFGGYPWLAVLPAAFLPAGWYIVRSEGGLQRMTARWIADEERSWLNPKSVNQQWFGPRATLIAGAGTVAVFASWPEPVTRWLLTFALAALTIALARLDLVGFRGTSSHRLDVLHVSGEPNTYVAVCRTCSWIGEPESTLDDAEQDGRTHSPTIAGVIEVSTAPAYRSGRYTRDELRRLWNDATDNGAKFARLVARTGR